VFDLFTQGAPSERSGGGLGIGLALARHLVEMQGGRIEARSAGPGRGSEFIVTLPVACDIPAAAPPATPGEARIDRRVVIIDDNEDAAQSLAMLVEALGAQARTAHDGAAGIDTVLRFRPDVVLLDIGMPGIDGYETCRRIRDERAGQDAFIVAITGWGQDQDKERAVAAGFDAHLTKPAEPCALQRLLATGSRAR
jgi:CheY-like chemotaxis protein